MWWWRSTQMSASESKCGVFSFISFQEIQSVLEAYIEHLSIMILVHTDVSITSVWLAHSFMMRTVSVLQYWQLYVKTITTVATFGKSLKETESQSCAVRETRPARPDHRLGAAFGCRCSFPRMPSWRVSRVHMQVCTCIFTVPSHAVLNTERYGGERGRSQRSAYEWKPPLRH